MLKDPILIIDDNVMNLKLERLVLELEGYQIQIAKSGEEALFVLQSFHPRLILMDIQLPGMDGLELTRRLKADPKTKEIIILALTSYVVKGDEEKILAAGCDGYIHKPIDTQKLPEIVSEHLNRERGKGS